MIIRWPGSDPRPIYLGTLLRQLHLQPVAVLEFLTAMTDYVAARGSVLATRIEGWGSIGDLSPAPPHCQQVAAQAPPLARVCTARSTPAPEPPPSSPNSTQTQTQTPTPPPSGNPRAPPNHPPKKRKRLPEESSSEESSATPQRTPPRGPPPTPQCPRSPSPAPRPRSPPPPNPLARLPR